jgi:GR25 family glycosyltransferase involved in LPS biosynthesis
VIQFEKVFYINLKKRNDRKEKIEKELLKSKILKNIERFEAIDGTKIHPREIKILSKKAMQDVLCDEITWGLSLTQGAIGLALTYLEIFKIIENLNKPVMTFEDDIELTNEFDETLLKILHELPENFDICYLGYCDTKFDRIKFSENLFIPKGQFCCTPCLLISPQGAIKIKNLLNDLSIQIDSLLYQNFNHLNVYASDKKIIKTYNLDTDIQGKKSNCKNYKKQNYIFSTLAIGESWNNLALNLALDLKYFNQKLLVVTNDPKKYENIDNVITHEHNPKIFSFNDKIICFEKGLEIEDCVIVADCDSRILYENYKETYADFLININPGFHPSFSWGLVSRNEGGFFTSSDIESRIKGYGEKALQLCMENKFNYDSAHHWQESFLVLSKENGKEKNLLEIWKTLSKELDKYEILKNSKKIGVGEGNLIGIAVASSGITIHDQKICNFLGEHIKYNADGPRLYNYLKNFPKKKKVNYSDCKILLTKKTNVLFENKNVDLTFHLLDGKDFCAIEFEWNKNNAVDFLDHEFIINDKIYHFESEKNGSFIFEKASKIEIKHTYNWYGKREIKKIIDYAT